MLSRAFGWMAVFACLSAAAQSGAPRALDAAQIRATVSGKHVTDDRHWGHHYLADGRLLMHESGRERQGRWSVQHDQLCLLKPQVSKTEPICHGVQIQAGQVRYVEGEKVVYQGFVRGPTNARLFDSGRKR